ncbi:uncharacterized protein AAKU67_004487 [Oxalobacteraceae bacterium GrIS 2.11]
MKIKRCILIFVLASSTCFGASFDCSKAENATEAAICTDRNLSELDSTLSTRYIEIRKGLQKQDAENFRNDRIVWIKSRNKRCGSDANCLQLQYTDRLKLLSDSRIQSDFSGNWVIDLRSSDDIKQNIECGYSEFDIHQDAGKITGSHSYATIRCGRLNEGGEGTVQGIVIGDTAYLTVTSARDGTVVKGVAKIVRNKLDWRITDTVSAGDPNGDSPLILEKGLLTRQ